MWPPKQNTKDVLSTLMQEAKDLEQCDNPKDEDEVAGDELTDKEQLIDDNKDQTVMTKREKLVRYARKQKRFRCGRKRDPVCEVTTMTEYRNLCFAKMLSGRGNTVEVMPGSCEANFQLKEALGYDADESDIRLETDIVKMSVSMQVGKSFTFGNLEDRITKGLQA